MEKADPILLALLSLASAIIGGIISGWLNHIFTRNRESKKLHADLALKYRVDAWRALDALTQVPNMSADDYQKYVDDIPSKVGDIVLFSKNQDELDALENWDMKHSMTANEKTRNNENMESERKVRDILIRLLRKNIRIDLNLPETKTKYFFYRLKRDREYFEKNYNVQTKFKT